MKLWSINEKKFIQSYSFLTRSEKTDKLIRVTRCPTVNLSQGREKKLKKCIKTGRLQKDFVILQMFWHSCDVRCKGSHDTHGPGRNLCFYHRGMKQLQNYP